jgi:hypothetical protein
MANRDFDSPLESDFENAPGPGVMLQGSGASSARVNRTHRVVRERAKTLKARRSKIRSLWLPLSIFSSLLVGICVAVWSVLDQYDLTPTGTPVASYQMLVLVLWSVPVSAALLAVVWFRQSRTDAGVGGRY